MTFTNTTGAPATGVKLSISVPAGSGPSVVSGTADTSTTFADPVAPGASVSATFKVTSGRRPSTATWSARPSGRTRRAARSNPRQRPRRCGTSARSRSTSSASAPAPTRPTQFIELYNAGASAVDISNWTLTEHPTQQAPRRAVKIPAGTKLAAARLLPARPLQLRAGSARASAGETTIHVRSTTGIEAGETDRHRRRRPARSQASGRRPAAMTTLWQPLPRRAGDHDPRRLDQRAGHERGRLRGRPEDRHRLLGGNCTRWPRSPRSASRARKPPWRRRRPPARPTSR